MRKKIKKIQCCFCILAMNWAKAAVTTNEILRLILILMEHNNVAIKELLRMWLNLVERPDCGRGGEVQILHPISLLTFYKFYIIIYV